MTKKWWHNKVAYQIYPKSYMDSNGDGIGDLRGIIGKLDYLKELGVDIIWLSPIYKSPLADQGYDIADYYEIDPRFGTMDDMDELIAEAKKRDMYILMDLVVNHCSDEHEWFKKACEDPDGKYGKYFYIVDITRDTGSVSDTDRINRANCNLPTNWRSYFGGPVWDKLPGHDDKMYMHLFHKKQPDLNWENEEVREEVYKMVNWWLDKGLGGFRIDAIINIKKPSILHDYPADRTDGLCSMHMVLDDARGVGEFLKELKERTFEPHNSFTVGEVFDVDSEGVRDFISEEGYFSSMFDFSTVLLGTSEKGWYDFAPVKASDYIKATYEAQVNANGIGMMSNIIENHDEPRGVSHYLPELSGEEYERACKMLAMINMFKRGLPFIYQGQEIGMENCPFGSIDDIDDCSTKDEYEVARRAGLNDKEAFDAIKRMSRDNSRTPMQWDSSANAGFSTGTPWLMVNPNYDRINVSDELKNQDSLLNFYKRIIAVRKESEYSETLIYGDAEIMKQPDESVMSFYRVSDECRLLFLANYQENEVTVKLPDNERAECIIVDNMVANDTFNNITDTGSINLRPYEAVLVKIMSILT